jgi:hypothetical protein
MALGRSAGDMRTRRAGARACRQQLEKAQRTEKTAAAGGLKSTLQNKTTKSTTRESSRRWQQVSVSNESSALHANYQSREGSVDGELVVKSAFV